MFYLMGRLQGVAPILFHRLTEDTQTNIDVGISGPRRTVPEKEREAQSIVYRNGHGLYLPPANLRRCLIQGAQKAGAKVGKKALWPFLEATVFVEGDLIFGKDEPDFVHVCTGRRPPKTGMRCVIRRPALETGWTLPFKLVVTDDRRDPGQIERALAEAGLLVGLCDGRPEFGRFIVNDWTVVK